MASSRTNTWASNTVKDGEERRQVLDFVIKLYNEERPHMSIGNLTPEFVHTGVLGPHNYGRIIITKTVLL